MEVTLTERYLDLVHRGKNDAWRYAAGAFTILLFWLGAGRLLYGSFGETLASRPLLEFVAANFSILMLLAGLVAAVRWIHGRSLRSLVTPEPSLDWARIGRAAAVWAVLAALTAALEHVVFPDRYYLSFDAGRFVPFAAAAIVLTPVQCAAEELLFRGYVVQALGLITRRPLSIAVGSSAIFMVPHLLNPEVHQYGALVMALDYFAIGMVLALVVLRDGRLELAIGLHAANNVFLALVANYEGSAIATGAVFTARELDPWYSLMALIGSGLSFYWWFFARPARRDAPRERAQ